MRNEYANYKQEKNEVYEEVKETRTEVEEKPKSSAKRRITDETVKKKYKICNTKLLNVRSSPENVGNDNIITQIKEGDIVVTFGKENGYYKIKYKGEDAYILSDFCEEV